MADNLQNSDNTDAPLILWFRNDLRLSDNPALVSAAQSGRKIIPIYILDPSSHGPRPLGGASRWWLHGALEALQSHVRSKDGELFLFSGETKRILADLIKTTGAKALYWNRRYVEDERNLDAELKESFTKQGLEVKSFNSHLLREPWEVKSKAGTPMKVFTPFWRASRELRAIDAPLSIPDQLSFQTALPANKPSPVALDTVGLKPTKPNWAKEMEQEWQPGENHAAERLHGFLKSAAKNYSDNRNRPDMRGTSKLSPHLRFGEISPRQIWHATHAAFEMGTTNAPQSDLDKFLAEIGWREFSYHLLFQFPKLGTHNFMPRFDAFPWIENAAYLKAWQKGRTGYPIVDAGMRELYRTGWMHNRVRMITASFLIKHLMIDWRRGEEWFWDTLVDADPASNAASWQWVAGSGADAAPYYRIFAPVVQGEKFDPNGDYIRKYVPELARLPNKFIHKPWEAPHPILHQAGITLGRDYPHPIVDHAEARNKALEAFKSLQAVETNMPVESTL
jgi:deoxyribodipyrimidine photo-lyase